MTAVSGGRLRVAMVGLGDIAQKAYLPVLAARAELDVHLLTRDRATLDRLGDAYRIPHRYTDPEALLAAGVDAVFVHAATSAHGPLVERFLGAGLPVYVDKPLDRDLAGAERLVAAARAADCSLMVGFNRRYAPGYAELLALPRDVIVMEKNRVGLPEEARSMVFDDFIHVVDTLRFLAPGPITHTDVRTRVRDGLLHHVVLQLSGEGFTAIGIMNRLSGAVEESVEVMGAGRKRRVLNLADVKEYAGGTTITRRGDWTPVSRQRGIEQVCDAFLAAVRSGERLDAGDALATHALCEQIVTAAG